MNDLIKEVRAITDKVAAHQDNYPPFDLQNEAQRHQAGQLADAVEHLTLAANCLRAVFRC